MESIRLGIGPSAPEADYLQSLLEKQVFILFMHGTTVYDQRRKTFDKFTVPEGQTIVSFTSPGEYMIFNTVLTTYFTHNSNSRLQTLLPLMSVNDASDLYGKAEEIYWFINDIHMVPSKGLGWDVKEKPRDVLKGFKSRPFRGGESQFETFYRAGPGSIYPDMRFGIEHADEKKYMGLFEYTSKGVERVDVPNSFKLSELSEILPPNSILFTISCASWQTEIREPGIGTFRFNANPDELPEGARDVIRTAESLVRENELTYRATHPLLSSKYAAGWNTFHRLFRRVRIPIFTFYEDRSRPAFEAPAYALRNLPESTNNLEPYLDPISAQNFRNADVGLVTWKETKKSSRKTRRHRRSR